MMKANELRLGNKVFIDGKVFTIETISSNPFELYVEGIDYNYSLYAEPVILTSEILEKAGFKKFSNDYAKKGIILHTRKRGYVIRKSIPVIKSLHELQNLYFALTGEELEITL